MVTLGWSVLAHAWMPALCVALPLLALTMTSCSRDEPKPIDVSVRDVVIDPYAVDGRRVRLIGLLHRAREGDALYWQEQDIEKSLHNHAVAVRLPSSWPDGAERRGAYVAVEGVFEADHKDSGSNFNGTLLRASLAKCPMSGRTFVESWQLHDDRTAE